MCRTLGTQRNASLKVAGFDRSLTVARSQMPGNQPVGEGFIPALAGIFMVAANEPYLIA